MKRLLYLIIALPLWVNAQQTPVPAGFTPSTPQIQGRLNGVGVNARFGVYLGNNSFFELPTIKAFLDSLTAVRSAAGGVKFYQLLPPAPLGTDTRGVQYSFNPNGAQRLGGSDTTPQDDERNYGRLINPNWWGNQANVGIYSFAANRNSAAYAPYSVGFGHDNVIYGTAAMAGGAGSIAGDPNSILGVDANQNAYCSIVWGKNLMGKGAKSASFGEEGGAGSRANFTAGYYAVTNDTTAGIGTSAIGYNVTARGDGAFAYGQNLTGTNRAQLLGSGINDGNPMYMNRRSLGIGVGTFYPTMLFEPGDGTTNGRSKIGIGYYGYASKALLGVNGNLNVIGGDTLQNSANGDAGLHISFAGNTGYINSHVPGVAWQNLQMGANQISLRTNGTQRLFINTNGNIGIGTGTPQQKLDVNGNIAAVGFMIVDSGFTGLIKSNTLSSFRYWNYPNADGNIMVSTGVPTSSTAAGVDGQYAYDGNYFYWHAGGRWNRVARDPAF